MPPEIVHSKYRAKGAYHWPEIARSPRTYNCFTAARYEIALRLAGDLRGKRVLDFGCGDGAFLSQAAARGAKADGYEPDDRGRALAGRELSRRSIAARLFASPDELEPGAYDVVFCLEVIEHVDEPRALLRRIERLLAPDGMLVLTSPARLTEHPLDPDHVREYYPDELASIVGEVMEVSRREEAIPLAAVEVYFWAPRAVLGLPLVRWMMNAIAIVFRRNPIFGIGTYRRYFTQIAIQARKTVAGPGAGD